MKRILMSLLLGSCIFPTVQAQENHVSKVWVADQGDGTYKNPVLYADYSDPSSFGCLPGLQVLHSKDLVNWSFAGAAIPHALPPVTDTAPQHGNRVWAPCIRHHNGEFYIFWGDPDQGIFMVKAKDVKGPWSEPILVKAIKGIIDTTPLWDDDGRSSPYANSVPMPPGPSVHPASYSTDMKRTKLAKAPSFTNVTDIITCSSLPEECLPAGKW